MSGTDCGVQAPGHAIAARATRGFTRGYCYPTTSVDTRLWMAAMCMYGMYSLHFICSLGARRRACITSHRVGAVHCNCVGTPVRSPVCARAWKSMATYGCLTDGKAAPLDWPFNSEAIDVPCIAPSSACLHHVRAHSCLDTCLQPRRIPAVCECEHFGAAARATVKT